MDQQQENNEMWTIEKFYDAPNQYCPYITVGPAQIRFTQGYDPETDPQRKAEAEENARRIVACVNACAGWPTLFLEGIVTAGATLKQKSDEMALRAIDAEQQRDKLLAALKDVQQSFEAIGKVAPRSVAAAIAEIEK